MTTRDIEHITDYDLTVRAEEIAAEAFQQFPDDETAASDYIHESCDGMDWVVYHYKALTICARCCVDAGEQYVEEVGLPEKVTLWSLASLIVFGEMMNRAEIALAGLQRAATLGDDWASHVAPRNENGWTA